MRATAPVIGTSDAERRTAAGDGSQQNFSSSLSGLRLRGDNPVTGFATPRQPLTGGGNGDLVGFPFWGPWGQWYPWYTPGWGIGFYGYSPWYYGATCWNWGRWGAWYDPFGYCWSSYYWGAPTSYVEIAGTHHNYEKVVPKTGDVRIVASPKTAKVYIDDALAGTVDQFDGLNEHIEIDTGHHTISLKADGYQPVVKEIDVEGGRTQTVRITLKKIK